MLAVGVDLADDRFDVRHDARKIDAAAIAEAVRALGYSPEVVSGSHRPVPAPAYVDPASLPPGWREPFARAREQGVLVLVDFSAPG